MKNMQHNFNKEDGKNHLDWGQYWFFDALQHALGSEKTFGVQKSKNAKASRVKRCETLQEKYYLSVLIIFGSHKQDMECIS